MSIALSGIDARLLATYFVSPKAADLTPEQKTAISGYKLSGADGMQAMVDAARQSGRADPVTGRVVPGIPEYDSGIHSVVPPAERYDPQTHPLGARGTVYDVSRNIYGVDPKTGFALRTFDNVGVQYGLQAFTAGTITAKQFLDLNEAIGGLDQDANAIAARSVGDRGAIQRAYQSGLQFVGNGGLASIPVVNVTGRYNEDSAYHYLWFHFALRERMARANGNAANHVSWRGQDRYGAVRAHVEPARQLGRRNQEGYRPRHDAREDAAQQAVERRRWLLEERNGVHHGAGDAQQQTRHAL